MVSKISKKKQRKTPNISRKSKASIIAEEKQVGKEVVDWTSVAPSEFESSVYWTLRHYAYFYDYKDSAKWAREWAKKNLSKTLLSDIKRVEDWHISTTAGGLCKMMLNGADLGDRKTFWVKEKLKEASEYANKTKQVSKVDIPKKSPADIVKERTSEFIASIDDALDKWPESDEIVRVISVYSELQKAEAPYVTAKAIVDYYTPQRDEIEELVKKKTEDLVEGYSHLKIKERKELLKILQEIVSDAEKYMQSKKAARKPRKKKATSATQQTSKLKYMKESNEYKVTSIDPSKIIGASELYLFNTKTRTATYLASSSSKGFYIKGTTIQNVDADASYAKKIRKPEEWLQVIINTTKARARKTLSELSTKPSTANGRVNDQTLIVKVY